MHYALVQFISLVAREVNANVGLTFFCCIPIGSACTPLWSLLQQLYCWGFPTLILPHPVAISRPISDPPPSITTSCSCSWVIIMAIKSSVMFCTLKFENHFPNSGPENLIPSEDWGAFLHVFSPHLSTKWILLGRKEEGEHSFGHASLSMWLICYWPHAVGYIPSLLISCFCSIKKTK